ncbi:MAG: hypothetical protein JXA13_00965 [Anaerolineales bacterium]|nr:hypothetical protein [Anaerolineales bacterium]
MNKKWTVNNSAKTALFGLVLGVILLIGGIPFQIILGLGSAGANGEVEKLVYHLMSQGSMVLVAAYILTFVSGIAFWLLGPYSLKRDRWFLIAFLTFYLWLPLDWYFISLDLRFALTFDPALPLTSELEQLFDAREAFTPLPVLTLLGYLVGIGMAVFQPELSRKDKNKK